FPSIVDRPSSVLVYDGSNTLMAETDYTYDSYGPSGIALATATGHDDANYGPGFTVRGNATSITRKCFIPGTTNTCTDATTSYGFDQTGQVVTAQDANGNTTSYSYIDSNNTNAHITKITHPKTGDVDHVEQFSYAYADGRLTIAIDQNG